jgi:arylsulfatase A-like enzyme
LFPGKLANSLIAVANLSRLLFSLCLWSTLVNSQANNLPPRPNFILIMCDNLGYGDIEPFGSKLHRTPNLNRMAKEGRKLTSFYSASGVCTPSRAALMTGSYPRRVGLDSTPEDGHVLRPVSPNGLHPNEITIAEVLKSAGYATACIGKWHLGDQPEFLPTRQGFDYYLGVPYSDDMTHATGQRIGDRLRGKQWPPLPLMENEKVIVAPVDRNTLTTRETEAAIQFIAVNKKNPFFLYLPQAMPGSTRAPFASESFRGKSKNGPWGDSIEELDWSAGEILKALRKHDLDKKTLVLWTSDNGAPRRNPPQGSNLPLGGWGYTTAEGGMRVPAIIRWPGVIPPGSLNDELSSLMDLLPTFARLAGAKLPTHKIDGKNIWPLWSQLKAKTPHESFYYYHSQYLEAVRDARWKLYLPHSPNQPVRKGTKRRQQSVLYEVKTDIAEKHDVADRHPEIVKRLTQSARAARRDLGEGKQKGANVRPVGRAKNTTPRVQ